MPYDITPCDCGGYKHHFASTKSTGDLGKKREFTLFYECDNCLCIYFKSKSIEEFPNDTVTSSEYKKYEGRLTKEEINLYAKEFTKEISQEDEERIIKKRN